MRRNQGTHSIRGAEVQETARRTRESRFRRLWRLRETTSLRETILQISTRCLCCCVSDRSREGGVKTVGHVSEITGKILKIKVEIIIIFNVKSSMSNFFNYYKISISAFFRIIGTLFCVCFSHLFGAQVGKICK